MNIIDNNSAKYWTLKEILLWQPNLPKILRIEIIIALVFAGLLAGCGSGGDNADPVQAESAGNSATAPSTNPETKPATKLAFVDVSVVHPESQTFDEHQTVLVQNGLIQSVGATANVQVPDDAEVIDGRGRYLTPGLVDMHVHTTGTLKGLQSDYRLFLAKGVTTVRVMWGIPVLLQERSLIEAGSTIAPSLILASPGLDGPGGAWADVTPPVSTPAKARIQVNTYAATGFDFIKVYNNLTPDVYDAIVDEAAAKDMLVVGHVPRQVGIDHVRDSGQRTSEHLIGIKYRASSPFTGGELDLDEVWTLAQASAGAGMWHTPTITVDALSRSEAMAIRVGDEVNFVSEGMRRSFENGFHQGLDNTLAAKERENHEVIVKAIHDSGGKVLVGTDAGFGWMIPGFSFHDEMAALVRAGLTSAEVLNAATAEAANAMEKEDVFGRIATGLRADLVLVDQNPLEDVGAMEEISGVVARGSWYSQETISGWLTNANQLKSTSGSAGSVDQAFPEPNADH